jgi:pentatricopeptide repeat protein
VRVRQSLWLQSKCGERRVILLWLARCTVQLIAKEDHPHGKSGDFGDFALLFGFTRNAHVWLDEREPLSITLEVTAGEKKGSAKTIVLITATTSPITASPSAVAMLKCRNCARNHLQTLLSIHASPPAQFATRSFSFSAVAAAGPDNVNSGRGGNRRQTGTPRRESGLRDLTGSSIHRPQLDTLKVAIPLGGGYTLQTRDPLRVLSEVNGFLERGNFDKAHALVEKLTGKIETTHSWNALIKYLLDRRKVVAALKMYNDMKKRQVKPDPYTYSHLFAGLAAQPVIIPSFLKAADKIYDHVKNNSPGREASPLHVNAYLTVCMRAGDIERAWKLLSELPQTGPNAPDAATFTIFLRALRGRGEEALGDGKRVWSGILSRWRKGDLQLDEYLLNSYLELLLYGGTAKSWQEVFTVARQWIDFPYPDDIPTPGPNDPNFLSAVRPDDFTLGIILKAAEKLKNFRLAEITWNTLTERYGHTPSAIAKHFYLRCASISHDGKAAARVLSDPSMESTEWDFVRGLKACVTSGGKQESYNTAEKILQKAEEAEQAGVLVVRTFLLVALTTCDGGIIKRALRRIERSLRPSNLEVWEKTMLKLPREPAEIVVTFLATLKKAIFWDTVKWGRHEETRYMDKFREVKKIMKGWEGVRAEELGVDEEVDEEEETKKDAAMVFDGIARKKGDQPVSEEMENDRLYKAMADLRRHSPMQRRKFINSL